ncbi:MAG: ATP-binding cassette domain-containing protein [Spirochaetes bacterium]|nr:ATP-binding cassette domain-containing protein [Spirochaetota bacterium]
MIELKLKKNLVHGKSVFALNVDMSTSAETLFLVGHSGSGKTTILNMIAGLLTPDSGLICIDNRILFDSKLRICLPACRRKAGYLFQDNRLFRHMNVEQNISYAAGKKDRDFIGILIETAGLGEIKNYPVSKLSGGQKQRVALARALAVRPDILLLDEPFSSLDFERTQDLIRLYKNLRSLLRFKSIIVTHTVREALLLEGDIAEIKNGKCISLITPEKDIRNNIGYCSLLRKLNMVS